MCLRQPIHYFLYAVCFIVSIATAADWQFTGANIALNKRASQKPGTYINDFSPVIGYPASLAVDGNENSDFYNGSCSHTTGSHYHGNDHVAQWIVDLGGQYYVTGITIVNRNERMDRLKGFLLFGCPSKMCHDDGWYQIYNDNPKHTYGQGIIQIALDHPNSFSKIAMNLPKHQGYPDEGVSYLTLCEVKVYAATCGYMDITNGEMTPRQDRYDFGTQVNIVCKEGFKSKLKTITCNAKEWNYVTCEFIYCAYPGKLLNGNYTKENFQNYAFNASLPYKSVITVKCNLGYQSEYTEKRTCQNDGTWSGEEPVCKKVQCPYPGSIVGGKYQLQNGSLYEFGSSYYNTTVQVKCNTGYVIDGDKERTCNANKIWNGETKCSLVTCSLPPLPEGGFYGIILSNALIFPYNSNMSSYSSEIRALCPEGYFLIPTSSVRRCLETGFWSGEQGKCVLVTCRKPEEIKNGFYNYTKELLSEKAPYNTIATTVCHDSFELVNPENRERRCTEAGVWDKKPASCVKVHTQLAISKAVFIGGTVTAAGLFILATSIALFLLYRRRKRHQDNSDRSTRYRNVKNENTSKSSTNPPAIEYADVLPSNCADMSQEGTPRVALDKKQAGPNKSTVYSSSDEVIEAGVSSSSWQSHQEYYSFMGMEKIPVTAIKIQDLSDITLNETGKKERFQKEFENLPQGMVEAYKDALKPQNRGKNRYKNLYAYDNTRVILDVEDELDSDYINACFVHGFNKARKYIASQGPTEEILVDFWRMIWQTECCKIVMLTNLHEGGKMKCEQYWPSHGSQTYGRITVKMKHTEPFSQFVIRTFTLQKDGSPDRIVTQFHFTAWPGRGVPKYASPMVQFLSKVKYFPSHGDGPIVVHCSAGVGRTGTFIALDNVTEQGKAMGYVDVAGVVESMRHQRVNSVQTLEQYIFVYQAVTEALMLSTSAIPAAKFPDAYKKLLQTDRKKKKRKLNLEFEALKKMSPVAEENQYVSSKVVRNRNKNRYSNVFPIEGYMPSLTKGDGTENCEYINAVFLPSYKEKKAFIITQTPLESTVEDFWRLIWEHDIHTLVMMNNQEEMTNSEVYWPNDNQTISFGNISITNDSTTTINKHTVFSLTVKKFVVSRHIRLFQVGGWKSQNSLPKSTDVILSLMELVQSWQQQTGNHTILVHCMNGVEKSGLFCVISAVIERMKIEQDVAIPQVIEEMRNAREQIIPSVEQFQFCHEAVLAFIHQYDTYSNFTL